MHTHEMYEASLAVRRAKDTLARLSEWAAEAWVVYSFSVYTIRVKREPEPEAGEGA
jgi:hypothetical protein